MIERLPYIIHVLRTEAEAIARLATAATAQEEILKSTCELIQTRCGDDKPGRLVVTGIGKAGHIGRKLAATFASTGTPSFFLHPAEARHGDLGMVRSSDVVLALSNSGSSEEIVAILPSLRHIGVQLIAILGKPQSPLGSFADLTISIGAVTEACPLGLAPSTSTTVMLALGDAIALTVQKLRHFGPEQYARFHPGGALGRKLMACAEAMRSGTRVATINADQPVSASLQAITRARAGSAVVIDAQRRVLGIFTDGDLRRSLSTHPDPTAMLHGPVSAVATMPCTTVLGSRLLQDALHLCSQRKINELPVVDEHGLLLGLLDVQDLVDRGFEIEPRIA